MLVQGWTLQSSLCHIRRRRPVQLNYGFIQQLVGNYKLFSSKYLDINNIKLDINNFHYILGHPNERVLRKTSQSLDVSLLGTLDVCDSCSLAKAKRKNMNKINTHTSTKPCERIYADIPYVNTLSLGRKRFWILYVDEFTKFKWSNFVEKRSDFIPVTVSRIRELIYNNFKPRYLRLDNSGENIKLKMN